MHIFHVWFTWSMHVEIMIYHASHRFNKQTVTNGKHDQCMFIKVKAD